MGKKNRIFFILLLLLFTAITSNAEAYNINIIVPQDNDVQKKYPITKIFQLAESEPVKNFEDALYNKKWTPHDRFISRLRNDNNWYLFRINNQSNIKQWRVLINQYNVAEDFHIYIFEDEQKIYSINHSMMQALGPYLTPNTLLNIEKNKTYTFLIYSEQENIQPLSIAMVPQDYVFEQQRMFNTIEGVIIGLFISMIFYNLFLFAKTKHKSYFYYVIFHYALLIYQLYSLGLLDHIIEANLFMVDKDVAEKVFIAFIALLANWFTYNFLNIKENLTFFYTPILINTIFWVLYTFLLLWTGEHLLFDITMYFLLIFSFSLAFVLGIMLWGKGFGEAKYYILAWGAFIVLYFLDKASQLNLLPFSLEDFYLINFGIVIESIIMSIAPLEIIQQIKRKNDEDSFEIQKNKEKTEQKSDFLSSMAHEIKTPMNGVIGVAHLLKETKLTQEQEEYIETIQSSGKNLITIIEDILNYSKSESGNIQIEDADFYFDEMLDDVISIFRTQYFDKKIPLYFSVDSKVPKIVRGDSEKIKQVLINFVGNAYKFTKEGYIKINVNYIEQQEQHSHRLLFEVIDSGIGLNEQEKNNLFNPFYQANETINRKYGGTGLGLVISKNIIELMNGSVGIKSAKGQGSTFWFEIELKEGIHSINQFDWFSFPELEQKNIALATNDSNLLDTYQSIFSRQQKSIDALKFDNEETLLNIAEQYDIIFFDTDTIEQSVFEHITSKELLKRKIILILKRFDYSLNYNQIEKLTTSDKILVNTIKCLNSEDINVLQRQTAQETDRIESRNPANYQSSLKALIAEDDRASQVILKKQLEKEGVEVVMCNNGEEAYEVFKKSPDEFNVIITDYQMPIMNGAQLIANIRQFEQDNNLKKIYAVGLSADESFLDEGFCSSYNIHYCATKPLNKEKVKDIVNFIYKK